MPGVAYVGSKACAECHPDIYQSYLKTDMGRSMSLPAQRQELQNLTAPVRVKHPKANRYFEVYRRGTDYYETEYELDADEKEVFRDEEKLSYLMGSGANGFTGVVQRGDFLFEAPLSYYSKARAWGLSPGYEDRDYSFTRPIQADCISCHSARPRPSAEVDGQFREPPFEELSIGCESCHGPGSLHVAERRRGAPLSGPHDSSIVNPSGLPAWLANNICMYCHQALDAAARMPRKRYADFRPGTPLTDTLAIFAIPFRREAPPQEPLLQHFVLMSLSRCYLESGRKLSCITCHDPHRQPSPAEAPAYFRARCLTCHTEKSCALPLEARRAQTPPDDCAGCHMPKQSLAAISHSSLTNHRIIARPGEPLPEMAFHLASASLPDLVHLDAIPGKAEDAIPPLTLLRAYGQLMSSHEEYRARFEAMVGLLAQTKNPDPLVLSALATQEMKKGTPESEAAAEQYLQQALRAGSTSPDDFERLATLEVNGGRTPDAIATVKRGLDVNPYSPQLYRLLAALQVSSGAYDDAMNTMKKDLELFPEDSFIRSLLERAEKAKAQDGNHP